MGRGKIIVAIDAGTTKVCTLIAEIGKEDTIHIIGVGVCPSRGLRKGVVVNKEGNEDNLKLDIFFKGGPGKKKVAVNYVNLIVL